MNLIESIPNLDVEIVEQWDGYDQECYVPHVFRYLGINSIHIFYMFGKMYNSPFDISGLCNFTLLQSLTAVKNMSYQVMHTTLIRVLLFLIGVGFCGGRGLHPLLLILFFHHLVHSFVKSQICHFFTSQTFVSITYVFHLRSNFDAVCYWLSSQGL